MFALWCEVDKRGSDRWRWRGSLSEEHREKKNKTNQSKEKLYKPQTKPQCWKNKNNNWSVCKTLSLEVEYWELGLNTARCRLLQLWWWTAGVCWRKPTTGAAGSISDAFWKTCCQAGQIVAFMVGSNVELFFKWPQAGPLCGCAWATCGLFLWDTMDICRELLWSVVHNASAIQSAVNQFLIMLWMEETQLFWLL